MSILEWISKNLFTVLVIAGVLAQLIQAVKGKKEEAENDQPTVETPETQFGEIPDEDERARRIREEIRRKIAERRAETGESPVPEPEPAAYDEPPPLMRDEPVAPPVVTRSVIAERAPEAAAALQRQERFDAQRQAEILEQQAAMADRMRELEAMKAAAQRRAAFEALSVSQTTVQREKTRGAVLEDLRDPQALRRAFILREVLGPPVSLR